MTRSLQDLLAPLHVSPSLWSPGYKIPWHDPEFSRRMLDEHLNQEHDLASRRAEAIAAQADWISHEILDAVPARILDLGCGPGLYAPNLAHSGHSYRGVDFGPASIAYARELHEIPGRVEFVLGDVLATPFQGPYDLALMLYGELNVFPPKDSARLLSKAHDALTPGGALLLEVHTLEAVKALGQGQSWFMAESGLFSDSPHLVLTNGEWFETEQTARQTFHVIDAATARVTTMYSTTKGWTTSEYQAMLEKAGFADVEFRKDWPEGREELILACAKRAG